MIIQAVRDAMVAQSERLSCLYDRWQDEREYEDFNDYIEEFKKLMPPSFVFVRATKRPFAFTMRYGNVDATIKVTSRHITTTFKRAS